jgi:dTDP-4-amino-4,6-dideoxygalactose transaminase
MSDRSDRRVPLCEPCLGGNAEAYLRDCLVSGWVSSAGPFVERFERAFAERVGARQAVACASGTAALHLACRVIDLGPGDDVFVSTLTFIASANPVRYQGATPLLVDCEAQSWNLDPDLMMEEIAHRARHGRRQPRAVIVVHLLGHPARLAELAQLCDRHGIVLIEDAAEALGATFRGGSLDGRQVGTVGRIGCFSFNGNKIITAGGGGMLVTEDAALARRARHLSTQARLPGAEYRHDEVGYNYRLTNLAAALALSQLEQLDAFLAAKRAIAARYDAAFAPVPGLSPQIDAPWGHSSRWLYSMTVDPTQAGVDRTALQTALRGVGIETRPLWAPLHLQTPYRDVPRLGGAVAERLFQQGLSLPCSVGLTPADQAAVIGAVLARTRMAA